MTVKDFNLNVRQLKAIEDNVDTFYDYAPHFYDFLASGKSELSYRKKYPIFAHDNNFYLSKDGIIIPANDEDHDNDYCCDPEALADSIRDNLTRRPNETLLRGVLVKQGKQLVFLRNGDENLDDLYINSDDVNHKTISFVCLSRFYPKGTPNLIAKKLVDQELVLVDSAADKTKELTATERKAITAWNRSKDSYGGTKKPFPLVPPVGFAFVGGDWHQSATCLFYDKKKKFTILMGQDDGSYFGVELKDNPKTLKAAYESLIPEAAKGKKWQRQGEWFAVADKEPPLTECTIEFNGDTEAVNLNRDSDESSRHFVAGTIVRVHNNIVYGFNSYLQHENGDHPDLHSGGWVSYHRNTAVRAFSVKGVD